jgi:hypothetical protein
MSFKLENYLPDLIKDLENLDNSVLKKIGDELVEDVRKNTPVDSGALKKSIKCHIKDKKITIGSDLPYATKVEFEDKSYIRKTLTEKKDSIANAISEGLKGVMGEWN